MTPEQRKRCEELAELEANYFSNIQFPDEWIDTQVEGLKQDVNAARRKRCHDDHKWGFQKGYAAAIADCAEREKIVSQKLTTILATSKEIENNIHLILERLKGKP
jgi:hypothetical protein